MKNFCYLLAISLLTLQVSAADTTNYIGVTNLANVHLADVKFTGPTNLSNVTLSSAIVTGPLKFEKLTLSGNTNIIGPMNGSFGKFGKLNVTGSLSIHDTEINSLNVIGSAHFEKVNIKSDSNIVGKLEAKKTIFNNLTITAKNIKLSETKANNITIKDNSKEPFLKGEQVFELKNETIINGDVTFESKLGKILISKDSRINGKVTGAEVHNLE